MDYPAIAEAEMVAEKPYDAGDAEQVNEARKKAGRKKREDLDVVHALMQHAKGRMWLYEWLEACKIFSSPIVPNDTHFTYHNIGEQNIGKRLLQQITEAAPEQYMLMMQEAREK
jgi:hypothetical protein